jgi:uncharacterized protein involved in exopolysaccharide biosynthesis
LLSQERLIRNVDVQKGVFITLKQQLELAKVEEVQKGSFVQILDYPSLPIKVSNPIQTSLYIVGGILGLVLGIALALVIEYFNNTDSSEKSKLVAAKDNFLKPFTNLVKTISNKNKND